MKDKDLGWQIQTVESAFRDYLKTGDIPAPYYPLRVAILLRKAKENERERAFLAAWCRHFEAGSGIGATYPKLHERARKTGARHGSPAVGRPHIGALAGRRGA